MEDPRVEDQPREDQEYKEDAVASRRLWRCEKWESNETWLGCETPRTLMGDAKGVGDAEAWMTPTSPATVEAAPAAAPAEGERFPAAYASPREESTALSAAGK